MRYRLSMVDAAHALCVMDPLRKPAGFGEFGLKAISDAIRLDLRLRPSAPLHPLRGRHKNPVLIEQSARESATEVAIKRHCLP
jgi:hypothetical protein